MFAFSPLKHKFVSEWYLVVLQSTLLDSPAAGDHFNNVTSRYVSKFIRKVSQCRNTVIIQRSQSDHGQRSNKNLARRATFVYSCINIISCFLFPVFNHWLNHACDPAQGTPPFMFMVRTYDYMLHPWTGKNRNEGN